MWDDLGIHAACPLRVSRRQQALPKALLCGGECTNPLLPGVGMRFNPCPRNHNQAGCVPVLSLRPLC